MPLNNAGYLPTAIAVLVALVVDREAGIAHWATLAIGLCAGTAVAIGLELQRWTPQLRPRFVWIVPLWMVGVAGLGGVLFVPVSPYLGGGLMAAAGVALAIHIARHSRGPGGAWVAVMVGIAFAMTIEVLVEYTLHGDARSVPGMAIRGVLLAGFLYAVVRFVLARRRARG